MKWSVVGGSRPYATPLTTIHLVGSQGSYEETKPLFQRSLTIREEVLGPDHPDFAASLSNLAGLLESQVRTP